MAFTSQIDPAVLQRLLAGQGVDGWQIGYQNPNDTNPNESASGPGTMGIYDVGSDQGRYGVYDQSGKLLDDRSKESSSAQLYRFLAGAAAMYGAGSLVNGGFLGMGGGGVPSSISGITPSAFTPAGPGSLGLGNAALGASVPSSISGLTLEAMAPAGAGSIGLGNAALGPSQIGASLASAGGAAGGIGGAASGAGSVASGLGSLGNLGSLAGALAGAAGSGDQRQTSDTTSTTTGASTSTRDPYAPSRPFIDQQITQGQQLATQYQQQPFSAAQQTGYNNLGGLLNAINGNVGGLLSGMGAASSGANNFDRSNPRKALQGGGINLGGWSPGLLQFFPNGGR